MTYYLKRYLSFCYQINHRYFIEKTFQTLIQGSNEPFNKIAAVNGITAHPEEMKNPSLLIESPCSSINAAN